MWSLVFNRMYKHQTSYKLIPLNAIVVKSATYNKLIHTMEKSPAVSEKSLQLIQDGLESSNGLKCCITMYLLKIYFPAHRQVFYYIPAHTLHIHSCGLRDEIWIGSIWVGWTSIWMDLDWMKKNWPTSNSEADKICIIRPRGDGSVIYHDESYSIIR